ncbi:MAG: MBOAT family protein [Flavobacteriales bacterium]|nr:MBOAT family protein [Flavobacteriales bacterium]MBK6945511.1 MBOAT family protein [Flavobacteriales bacterium]MBK7241626.1 MBOAT family protein [Flavobacteriales bacterium]MBK9534933.1 MBOAT family protein [Flavobacteriales bacterium]MBP9138497.1 MBOAT family protein [Flavobacteriales bacterium]
MVFFSFGFLGFFAVVLLLYWTIAKRSALYQNAVLLAASILFYAWLDLRFLGLLAISAAANFGIALAIDRADRDPVRLFWFWTGIAINIGALGFFKYFGFFYDSMVDLLGHMGITAHYLVLRIALPLGISFYTFQMLGYLLDVNNGLQKATKEPLSFFTYVFHFPKILAGPVERARIFLPRLEVVRKISTTEISDALRQILWGLFAKIVIADNCSVLVDPIYNNIESANGSTLLLGAFLYLIQLYADFSGYSNIAIGLSKLLGLPLQINFRAPIFATNVGDFWRRWHVSLTSWMMDHVFTPLNFILRAQGRTGLAISIFITFLAVGIWHGANWTFILFGTLQGLFFIPLVIRGNVTSQPSNAKGSVFQLSRLFSISATFLLMSMSFILMRAPDLGSAVDYWLGILDPSILARPTLIMNATPFLVSFFLVIEWWGREDGYALARSTSIGPMFLRWSLFAFLVFLIGMYMTNNADAFIYLQF